MYVRYYKINNEDALIIVTISSLSLSILINVLHRIRSFSLHFILLLEYFLSRLRPLLPVMVPRRLEVSIELCYRRGDCVSDQLVL